MKVKWKSYWEPTPKRIRQVADAILASAVTVSTFAMINDSPKLGTVVMIMAGIAKFISNFFSEDKNENPVP